MKLAEKLLSLFEMSYDDALKLFGIKDTNDLDKVYKKLAMQHHPDRGGSVEMMQKVNQAYDLLKSMGRSSSGQDFNKAKEDALAKRKENYKVLKRMSEELIARIKDSLPSYSQHFEPFFNLKKPEVTLKLDQPKTAWGYDIADIKVKFESEDAKTYIQLEINMWADQNKGGLTAGSGSEYVISYNTFLYHNRKTHKMVQSRFKTYNKSSNDILVPEIVFPKKKLANVLKKEAKKLSKKDFEAAILVELKKYQASYERYANGFVLHKPIEDNIVPILYRSVIMRQAGWTIMFKKKNEKGGLSQAVMPKSSGGGLPDHIKSTTFILPENSKGLDLMLKFFDDVYRGRNVDNTYFKQAYEANESMGEDMKLAERILEVAGDAKVDMKARLEKAKDSLRDEEEKVKKYQAFQKRSDLKDRKSDYKRMEQSAKNKVASLKSFISDYEAKLRN